MRVDVISGGFYRIGVDVFVNQVIFIEQLVFVVVKAVT